ncbi:hypothetical protein GJS26_03382 [Pectobacterium carotovorum subsp. carotovorum]|nr:hypothetical protein [Pectobacterium carotovorum subsp. carotovorum]
MSQKLGSFEAKLGAKITSVTSGHNVTCFDCEVMISPLFRWPNSVCHYSVHFTWVKSIRALRVVYLHFH